MAQGGACLHRIVRCDGRGVELVTSSDAPRGANNFENMAQETFEVVKAYVVNEVIEMREGDHDIAFLDASENAPANTNRHAYQNNNHIESCNKRFGENECEKNPGNVSENSRRERELCHSECFGQPIMIWADIHVVNENIVLGCDHHGSLYILLIEQSDADSQKSNQSQQLFASPASENVDENYGITNFY